MTTHINCTDIVDFTFGLGWWFIIVALVAAAAMAAVEAYAKLRAANATRGRGHEGITEEKATALLGALKDLLIALGNLPAWFALFLAGGALIWFARDTLSLCH